MSHFEKLEKHSSSYGRVFVFEVERRGADTLPIIVPGNTARAPGNGGSEKQA